MTVEYLHSDKPTTLVAALDQMLYIHKSPVALLLLEQGKDRVTGQCGLQAHLREYPDWGHQDVQNVADNLEAFSIANLQHENGISILILTPEIWAKKVTRQTIAALDQALTPRVL